jgi:glycosyltransferase involved in cell wall biosynthesis
MKVLVDVQALQSPVSKERGIGRYAHGLVQALCDCRPAWDIVTVESAWLPRAGGLSNYRRGVFKLPLVRAPDTALVNSRLYGDWLATQKPDVILLLHTQDEQVLLPEFSRPHPRVVGILYDVIPLLFADHYLRDARTRKQYAAGFRALCRCDDIMAISGASGDDFRRIAPERAGRVTVIGGGVAAYFSQRSTDQEPAPRHFAIREGFLLYVGGFDFRKNWRVALEAYASLSPSERTGLSFVMACALEPAARATVLSHAAKLGITDNVHLTGQVSDRDLRWLYRHCRVMFFPSLYEGLGFPVLEALACGAPVVTSKRSSLAECGGQVSWLVDPANVADCRRGLREALAEPRQARFHERLRHAAQFSWNDVGEKAARCLERRLPPSKTSQRGRIAWVSPMPPDETGVADYSALILEGLLESYEIDVVSDNAPCRGEVLVEEAISSHQAKPYDAFVYQLGNSRFHAYALPLLARYRGLVALHDLHFDGLLLAAIRQGIWTRSLNRELKRGGELSLAHALECGEITEHEAAQPFRPLGAAATTGSGVFAGRAGVEGETPPFPAWLLSRASHLVVHSEWSRNVLSAWTDRPIHRIPLPVRPTLGGDPLAARRRLGISPDRLILVTLGTVGPSCRVPSILKALSRLPGVLRERCSLYIVGAVPGMLQNELRELGHALGLTERLAFMGRVPAEKFSGYVHAADLCIQLRHPTRGESSAALLEALAAGAPCVISAQGPGEEIPSAAAVRIRPGEFEVDDLVAAIQRLLQDRNGRRRLGQAAADYVREAHSLVTVVQQYEQAIELAIAERTHFAWLETACLALSSLSGTAPHHHLIDHWAGLRTLGTAGGEASQILPHPEERTAGG